jgi:hypothetical protein
VGVLLFSTGGQIGNHLIFLPRRGEDFPVAGVHDENLGGLGAAIDAKQQCSHTWFDSKTIPEIPSAIGGEKDFM